MRRFLLILMAAVMVALPAFADPAAADDWEDGDGNITISPSPRVAVEPAVVAAPNVVLAGEDDFHRSGTYGQVGLAVGWLPEWDGNDATILPAAREIGDFIGASTNAGVGFGLDARLGQRINEWFATEFQLNYVPNTDLEWGGLRIAEYDWLGFGVNAKFYPLPLASVGLLDGRIQPYALVGVGGLYGRLQASNDLIDGKDCLGFMWKAGAGLDAYVTNSLFLYADAAYLGSPGDLGSANLNPIVLTAGLGVRF